MFQGAVAVMEETFAEKLKRLREEAGLSQAALAEKTGMNLSTIAKIEQGLREPGWATVQKLARALGVSCEVFMDEPPPQPTKAKRRGK